MNRRTAAVAATILMLVVAAVTAARTGQAAARPPTKAAVRILVYHDMEGLAGQDDWRTYLFSQPEKYPEGQRMLAADLNAVIDGLFAGGATRRAHRRSSFVPSPKVTPR